MSPAITDLKNRTPPFPEYKVEASKLGGLPSDLAPSRAWVWTQH